MVADPSQIEQVLLNLAFNARDAMPGGGELRISTEIETLSSPRSVGLNTLEPGEYVVLGLCDTGTGIPPELLDKIFEPFFTTKPRDRGTGLGLSTVYGIARQLGGAVGVASTLGKGASFSVWIPFRADASRAEASDETESSWPECPASTILFVDDDEAVRALASRILAKGGHRVLVAANAGEALLIIETHGSRIDLLVTDTVMPFMDGHSLARRVLETLPGIGLLFISGHPGHGNDPEDQGRFLAKPFNEAELAKAVTRAINRARGAAEASEARP